MEFVENREVEKEQLKAIFTDNSAPDIIEFTTSWSFPFIAPIIIEMTINA